MVEDIREKVSVEME
ncbi:hypothetical protein, partial [Escherichia coli]